jgi:hypothetical protein
VTARTVALALAVTAIAVLTLPFAPVVQTTALVQWPAPGQPVESTMLPLVPYRPLAMQVQLPCAAATGDDVVLFATYPLEGPGAGLGLTVTADEGEVRAVSETTTVWTGRVPSDDCALALSVDADETIVRVDDRPVGRAVVDPPRVAALATALPPDTAGLSAQVRPDSRFETSPTLVKTALLALAVLGAAACLATLASVDRSRHRASHRAPRLRRRLTWQDGLVGLVLGAWAVGGPMMADDGYNVAVAQGFGDIGYVGNYYHWYNAPEVPFSLLQQALVPLVELTRAPVFLRLPALLAAFATWAMLSRLLLPLLSTWRRSTMLWVGAVVFLAWWMPFNNSLRPEPWVALAATAVLCLVLRAIDTGRLVLLGAAGVVVALAVAVAPAGLLAAAPFLVLGRRVLDVLRAAPWPWWLAGAAVTAPGAAVLAVAVFADQSLGAVLEATRIHDVIGPSVPWYREIRRYEFLFGNEGEMAVFARRLVVLLLLGCVAFVVAQRRQLAVRAARGDVLLVAAGCVAVAVGVLVLTPTKWTHHFGGLAGYATVLFTGVVLRARDVLRAERSVAVSTAVTSVVVLALVSAAFAGPNTWWAYARLGVDPALPSPLASPALWVAAGLVAVGAAAWLRPAASRRTVLRWDTATALPATVVVLALATSVATMLGTHARAAVVLADTWSMTGQNVEHLTGGSCGMGDHMEVLLPSPLPAVAAGAGDKQSPAGAFREGGALLPGPASLPADAARWGTFGTGSGPPEAARGTLTTRWFAFPELEDGEEVGLFVAGRTSDGNEVVAEFASSTAADEVVARRAVSGGETDVYWRYVTIVRPRAVVGVDLVRLVVTDDTTGSDGWVAVTQPVHMTPSPVREVLQDEDVSLTLVVNFAFPCVEQVVVAHGLTELPQYVLTFEPRADAAEGYGLALDEEQAGSLVMARQASIPEVLPTRIPGVPPENVRRDDDLGTLSRWSYLYPADRYALTLGTRVVAGTAWGYRYPIPIPDDTLPDGSPDLVDKGPGLGPVLDTRPGAQDGPEDDGDDP